MAEPVELLDGPASSACYWTTVNASEALPGIITPLNWSWYYRPSELSLFGIFKAYGVLPADMAIPFNEPDQRFMGVFLGRYCINVDTFRRMADRTPGTSGDDNERQFFGETRPGIAAHRSRRRYGIVALKLPRTMMVSHRRMRRVREQVGPWWQARVGELATASPERAYAIMREANDNFAQAQAIHILCSSVTQMIYQGIATLAQKAGLAGIETSLVTGLGMEEIAVQEDLWAISRGERGSVEEVVRHHGFTGPGELARPSWREDPSTALEMVNRFAELADDKRPSLIAKRQSREREAAERKFLAAMSVVTRPIARLLLRGARAYMPLRESGRAALLHGVDVGRAAAHVIGQGLVARDIIDRKDDIFFLDMDEIGDVLGAVPAVTARTIVARRRARRAYYQSIELPQAWDGRPAPMAITDVAVDTVSVLHGIGVTPHSTSGVARVVVDPADSDDFEDGEILVCPLTDPSWASLFVVAAGVVIDVGGPLSHGAIVAREMGIPCIINVKSGTRHIKTGDIIHLDGPGGTVTIMPPSSVPAETGAQT